MFDPYLYFAHNISIMNNPNERSVESATSINKPIPIIRYCLYARKSMEDEERQALSIDSQLKEMKQIAERDNLCIVAIRTESHSAKSSGMRPVFNKIIEEIRAKKEYVLW